MSEKVRFGDIELVPGQCIAFRLGVSPCPRFEGKVIGLDDTGRIIVECADILPYRERHAFTRAELSIWQIL